MKFYLAGAVLAALFAILLAFMAIRQQVRARREVIRCTRELREARARLQGVVDVSKLGFWDWDLVRNVMVYSGCWASMLGYRLDELEPRYETWAERIHPDDKAEALQAMDDLLQGRCESYVFDHRLLTRAGEWRWIRTSGSVLSRSEAGKPLHIQVPIPIYTN